MKALNMVFLYILIAYLTNSFIGEANRFEKSTFIKPWCGVYDAIGKRDACIQPNTTLKTSEDCLYLNIWKPTKHSEKLLPVMVWIHGGGFQVGSIFMEEYDSRYLASWGNVIVVSVNYRLGALGFLYLENENAIGNQGLHDQILALKWVQKNIQKFGGDPNRVTVFGESAGSMSVGSLLLSPLAKGLFQNAISQSGAPNLFFTITKEEANQRTLNLAKKLNCPCNTPKKVLSCLQNKTVDQLLNNPYDINKQNVMVPIYGDDLMPTNPITALKQNQFNDVNFMFGVCKNELTESIQLFLNINHPQMKLTMQNVKELIEYFFQLYKQNYADEAIKFYMENLNSTDQDVLKFASNFKIIFIKF